MPFISKASIQEVADRLDAIAVVSDYVQLEKRGGRFWACCPFHQEKTGSFTVNPEMKTYYCFGCHKGGTVISFIMEMDKLSFPEAIEALAKRFSVELTYENAGNQNADDEKKREKDELLELYHRMSGTFQYYLMEKPEARTAMQYIIARGINREMIKRFRLGYSPAGRYWLHNFLSKKGYSRVFLASSGLFSSRYPELSLFSGRLMFPIADRQGRTVAFGGRCLEGQDRGPKYINSPELPIYKKREALFGLDLALPGIRQTKNVYIAEGYMDVMALHQAGITNALAPLGTAFTAEQAKLLKRWAEKAILFFDADTAGQNAALKGILTCRENGLSCAVIAPDHGSEAKDPADILRLFGPEALNKKAKCFINDFEYLLDRARSLYDTSDSEGKAKAVAFLFPYMDLLDSEVAKGSCIETAADSLGLLPAVVAGEYRRFTREKGFRENGAGKTIPKEDSRQSGGRTDSPIRMNDELSLLLAVAVNYVSARKEIFFPKFRAALDINEIEDPNAKELYIALEECMRYGETSIDQFLARIASPELKKFFMERGATGEFSVNSGLLIADGVKKIKGKRLERRKDEIIVKIRSAKKIPEGDVSPDTDGSGVRGEVRELLAEIMWIDDELLQLKQGR
jgi:DNA primase